MIITITRVKELCIPYSEKKIVFSIYLLKKMVLIMQFVKGD